MCRVNSQIYIGFCKRRDNVHLRYWKDALELCRTALKSCSLHGVFGINEVNKYIFTLIPALNMVTAVVVLTKALVSGFLSSTLQHNGKHTHSVRKVDITRWSQEYYLIYKAMARREVEWHDAITFQVEEKTTTNLTLWTSMAGWTERICNQLHWETYNVTYINIAENVSCLYLVGQMLKGLAFRSITKKSWHWIFLQSEKFIFLNLGRIKQKLLE